MKAIRLHQFGSAENLRWEDVAEPSVASGQVLVRTEACGVCYHDVINRRGHLPRTKLPTILGHEMEGTVVEAGAGVTRFRPGDRVACLQRVNCGCCDFCTDSRPTLCRGGAVFFGEEIPGGYAEYFAAAEHVLAAVPPEVSPAEAAVTACTLGTAVHALGTRAEIKPGQVVLITGASGGVGVHSIQLAHNLGAHVVAVTSSESKTEQLKAWGAHTVIHAPQLEFARAVKKLVGPADVALEVVGSVTLDETLHALKSGGRLVVLGNVVSGKASFNPSLVILKELEIVGSFAVSLRELEKAFELVAGRQVKIAVSDCLPLREAVRAHRMLEERAVTGRLVLIP